MDFDRFGRRRRGVIETGGRGGALFHLRGDQYRALCGTERGRLSDDVERAELVPQHRECELCHLVDERDDLDADDLITCPVDGCGFNPEPRAAKAWDSWPADERNQRLRGMVAHHVEERHTDR